MRGMTGDGHHCLEGLAKKWELTAPEALVQTLKRLSYGQSAALIDGLERWWSQPETSATVEGFAAVGLVPAAENGAKENGAKVQD